MITPSTHASRRARLIEQVGGPVLLMGNGVRLRNLMLTELPFRQDSSFLYFTGCDLPDAAAVITKHGCTLFLPPPAEDDPLWHGQVHTLLDHQGALGVDDVQPRDALETACAGVGGLMTIAVADPKCTAIASRITGLPMTFGTHNGHEQLIDAIIRLRRTKGPEELAEHRRAAAATAVAFRSAMSATHPGGHEAHIAALFDGALAAQGLTTGYRSIVTVRGEVLHNPHYRFPLEAGQLLLLDGGGELGTGYGVDITRTWPVDGRFSPRQRAAYQAVLESQLVGIDLCRAGQRYRDVHLACARSLSEWLVHEGLLTCSVDEAMQTHAAAVFFPHGVGHLLGLDVHDLENFGDRAAYAPGRARSQHFGTAYLRMDLDLEPGMLMTIEPGFYVVPAILEDRALRERFKNQVNWEVAADWVGFGGVRIEDDVLCTREAPEVLTRDVPKTIEDLEAVVGSGPSAWARLTGAMG